MSKLKGQYWPGMGKMDLANEDMKRTRNQRKPKSSVDRMKRTSESIAPTQVVLNLDFEVEVVKGVYDPSSPVPIDEETVSKLGNILPYQIDNVIVGPSIESQSATEEEDQAPPRASLQCTNHEETKVKGRPIPGDKRQA